PEGITFTTQYEVDLFQINYPGCTDIEGNVIISGADIANLDGLGVLHSIGGNLRIEQNNSLANLQGLDNLSHINGDLIIGDIVWGQYPFSTGNPLLTSLAGLNSLVFIQGSFKLCGNYSLVTLSGLEHLAHIRGNLQLGGIEFVYGFTFGNPLLVNLTGLTRLTAIGGSLFVAGNSNLADLSGLDSLVTTGQHCWFDLNESLTTMQGLDQLTSIGGSLKIRWNNALSDISGLGHITSQSIQDLEIIYNHTLAECNIESICGYLADPNGTVEIYDNAPGCNSPEEVEAACDALSVSGVSRVNSLSLNPNPANDMVTISTAVSTDIARLLILTLTGQLVMELKFTGSQIRIDIGGLPPGVFIVRLQNEKSVAVTKLIRK
ncbi:MAG TPA: T9SS type A sorting domain-containing protein, partial [Lentimicrobium sp.]|nr:T9SS type A sorting domain-containing protein [Lentimicrobium sp.]